MMRRFLITALASAGIALASTAASADAPDANPTANPCTSGYAAASGGADAIACQGYYGGNILQTNDSVAIQSAISALLSQTPTDPNPQNGYVPLPFTYGGILETIDSLNSATNVATFNTLLSGQVIVGAHFGQNADPGAAGENSFTGFWLFNITSPTHSIVFDSPLGTSNVALFQTTGGAVPEPDTWAMMLLGFGGIGFAMRRTRKESGRLLQIA
jgi:hypothetical protein